MQQIPKSAVSATQLQEWRTALTFIPPDRKTKSGKNPPPRKRAKPTVLPYCAFAESETDFQVPKFFPLPLELGPLVIQIPAATLGRALSVAVDIQHGLRDYQQAAYDVIVNRLSQATETSPCGAFLCFPCGKGKTRTAAAVICAIGVCTLVLVTTKPLGRQFEREIKALAPQLRTAWLPKRPQDSLAPADIYFGTLQCICKRRYPASFFRTIGLLVVDECHHVAAPGFCQGMCTLPMAKVMGLSATPERKDLKEQLVYYLVGSTAFRTERAPNGAVQVHFLQHAEGVPTRRFNTPYDDLGSRVMLLGELARFEPLNKLFVGLLLDLCTRVPARGGILVLGKLIDHLHTLCDLFQEACVRNGLQHITHGYLTGRENEDTQRRSEQCQVIFGTFDLMKEGRDIPRLDTLLLISPAESLIQCMGRILREVPGKLDPEVYDYFDTSAAFKGETWSRIRQFADTGAQVYLPDRDEVCAGEEPTDSRPLFAFNFL